MQKDGVDETMIRNEWESLKYMYLIIVRENRDPGMNVAEWA